MPQKDERLQTAVRPSEAKLRMCRGSMLLRHSCCGCVRGAGVGLATQRANGGLLAGSSANHAAAASRQPSTAFAGGIQSARRAWQVSVSESAAVPRYARRHVRLQL